VEVRATKDEIKSAAASEEARKVASRFNEPKIAVQIRAKALKKMVGATGIEPVTPTMSTKATTSKTAEFCGGT